MDYIYDRHHLRVRLHTNGTAVPDDQRARMQRLLAPLADAVQDFSAAELAITINDHPASQTYRAELKLKLPGRTLLTADRDGYLDCAFDRGLRKLLRLVDDYKTQPNRAAERAAQRRAALHRDVVAPEGPDAGPLAAAVGRGDYRGFRTALGLYEEWLRLRVGRWVQRYPEAQARVGDGLLIGDMVEEVYLNAFETFARRKAAVRLSDWLDGLIDPSLRALLRHPDEVRENASLARTLRAARMD
jgi:hypothetical protein